MYVNGALPLVRLTVAEPLPLQPALVVEVVNARLVEELTVLEAAAVQPPVPVTRMKR